MRKISYFLVLLLIATQASATYIVILKNGTRYRAKDKWTLQGGKAIVQLEDGRTLQLDPNLIDNARSEEATRMGYGDAKVIQHREQMRARAPRRGPPSGDDSPPHRRHPRPAATSSAEGGKHGICTNALLRHGRSRPRCDGEVQ